MLDATGVAPNEKLLLGGASGLDPGFGVSQATHFVFSGSFRTIQASHSHLLEPVSLKALPNPEVVVPFPTLAGLANTSIQLPDFNSGTTGLLFRASKQLPLFSGNGAFRVDGLVGVPVGTGATALGLAISGLNWNPVSLREALEGAGLLLLLLPAPIGSGSLNLKLLLALEIMTAAAALVVDTFSFAGDENLYTLLLLDLSAELSVIAEVVTGLVLGFSDGCDDDDIGNLMSNLGTDFNPASCTSGSLTCGTGALLPRSEWDSSRIRCSLLRILLVCFTLLLLSSASAFGSL